MKVNVVKRKAASHKELSHVVYEIHDVKYLKELLYEIMVMELSSTPEISSPGKLAYNIWQEKEYHVDQAWTILKQDFEDGLFRVYFNGDEYTNLEDSLKIQEENELVIIKLVMIAGRLW
ncbi:MAG: hypothetical protein Q4B90_10265 [Eubacteriales bacterium]|nr:hypothetical protein [Eubacteriales bacterium]